LLSRHQNALAAAFVLEDDEYLAPDAPEILAAWDQAEAVLNDFYRYSDSRDLGDGRTVVCFGPEVPFEQVLSTLKQRDPEMWRRY